jgi:hypothetical protein
MTPEQRFDRLERIAKLLIKAGMRTRREMNEKINILLDAQIKNEERFAQTDEKIARLTESQAHSDRRLDALIDIIRREHEERDGDSGES